MTPQLRIFDPDAPIMEPQSQSAFGELDKVDLAKLGTHTVRALWALLGAVATVTLSVTFHSSIGLLAGPIIVGAGSFGQDIYTRLKRGWTPQDDESLGRNALAAVASVVAAYVAMFMGADPQGNLPAASGFLGILTAPVVTLLSDLVKRLSKDNTKGGSSSGGSAAAALLAIVLLSPATAHAQAPRLACDLPEQIRVWYHNPDGSCVQCSIGMLGADQNVPQAATLLWDTQYGPAVRGGSNVARVASYCDSRKIKAWSITGETTWDWMRWAAANGRGAAIGAGYRHFQTLVGHDAKAGRWYVCNNQTPTRIDVYDDATFRRLHLASGQWCVILDSPSAPARPEVRTWWE